MQIILASSSPRRAELLKQIGVEFVVKAMPINEDIVLNELPSDYVLRLSLQKAQAILTSAAESVHIIAADTTVVLNGKIFTQPQSYTEACAMWSALSGCVHLVMTGVTILSFNPQTGIKTTSSVTVTSVNFKSLTDVEMLNYWQTGEPLGKAGGYAIQGKAAVWVQSIIGSYSNVVGLPLAQTYAMLQAHGAVK